MVSPTLQYPSIKYMYTLLVSLNTFTNKTKHVHFEVAIHETKKDFEKTKKDFEKTKRTLVGCSVELVAKES